MVYSFGDCELDTRAGVLRVSGSVRPLEPQVLKLLVFLVENRDRVLSRDDLIEGVWGGRIVSDAAVATRINAVRRATGDDGRKQAVIRTLPKRGVRFVASVTEAAAPPPGGTADLPSLAVLPLTNLTGTADRRYLADGVADQLVSALGSVPWLRVIDPIASFSEDVARAGKTEIGRRLGVRYVIDGSLQSAGSALRISVRLSRCEDGRQIWSSTLTGESADLFDLQDDLVRQVHAAVAPRLQAVEMRRSEKKHGNLSAFDHFLRALACIRSMEPRASDEALAHLKATLRRNPNHAAAHALIGWLATLRLPQGRDPDLEGGIAHAEKAVSLDPFDAEALAFGGYAIGFLRRDPGAGLLHVERALELNGNSARAFDHRGWLLLYLGRAAEALDAFRMSRRLAPIDDLMFRPMTGEAFALLFLDQVDAAASLSGRALSSAPDFTICHRVRAAALAHAGRIDEAGRVVADLLARHPELTLSRYAAETRFQEAATVGKLMAGLRLAGLPPGGC